MSEIILCSNCFQDQGLKLDAYNIGLESNAFCPQCETRNGRKLTKRQIQQLAFRFFVLGTSKRTQYGGAPVIQFNEYHYKKTSIAVSQWLEKDLKLIEDSAQIGFFYYGPRLWMIGEVEPLKSLENKLERHIIINRILNEYPTKVLLKGETFYRLRKEPKVPSNFSEYDSPPKEYLGRGRLDSIQLPVMYGSQDLEVCIHECRATVDDELFLATLYPKRDLKLLDLTELLNEEGTEFESLDMAIYMLFLAGQHSYHISRKIAFAAYQAGFDGLIYPSYFSIICTGTIPFETIYGISIRRLPQYKEYEKSKVIGNIALFDRPIKNGIVGIKCINRLFLNKVKYDVRFGPVG